MCRSYHNNEVNLSSCLLSAHQNRTVSKVLNHSGNLWNLVIGYHWRVNKLEEHLTAPFNNKAQTTTAFFATVNKMFGGSS